MSIGNVYILKIQGSFPTQFLAHLILLLFCVCFVLKSVRKNDKKRILKFYEHLAP